MFVCLALSLEASLRYEGVAFDDAGPETGSSPGPCPGRAGGEDDCFDRRALLVAHAVDTRARQRVMGAFCLR